MDKDEKLAELFQYARQVARRVTAARFPGVDPEDLQQDLSEYIVKNYERIRMFGDTGNPILILTREANRRCMAEVQKSSVVLANQHYSQYEVRRMLEDCLIIQDILNTFVPETSRSFRPKRNRNANSNPLADWDAMACASDIRSHMKYLSEDEREILWRRYVLDDPETRTEVNKKRITRAIEHLTNELNAFAAMKGQWHEEHSSGFVGARSLVSREVPNE